jgi:DNA repair protein RecO (recombination protein O)
VAGDAPEFGVGRRGAVQGGADLDGHNGRVRLTRDEAVVLRTQKLGEADRIITLLTRSSGRVRAVGRGVRRTSSKFGARLEPFMHVDVQIAAGRTLDVVAQVETISAFARPIGADYARYTAGTAMLETAERLVAEEGEPALQHYLLLLSGLRALAEGAHEPTLVLDSFLLRALAVSGYAPSFDACARCGAAGPHRNFSAGAGGMLCNDCRLPGSARPTLEVVRLLGALLSGDWPTVEAVEPRFRSPASGIVAAYLQWHLERSLRSLPYVERIPLAEVSR